MWRPAGTVESGRHSVREGYRPIFNRTVIFEIGDNNYHGVRPVECVMGSRAMFRTLLSTEVKMSLLINSIYTPSLYQGKGFLFRRIVKDAVPPFLWRTLKRLRSVNAASAVEVVVAARSSLPSWMDMCWVECCGVMFNGVWLNVARSSLADAR